MNARSNIKGFFSYARQNDKHSGGGLTSLRKYLQAELWEQTGENIEIFQDQEDISWGELWKKKITTSLNSSKFLIAIVTPSYLKSEACRFELEQFLNLEKIIGTERILPLIYIDTPELKNTKDPVFSEINNRQWFDWTSLRFSSLTSTSAKKKIATFTRRIRELIADEIRPASSTKANFNIPNSVISTTISDNELPPSFNKIATTIQSDTKFKKHEEVAPPPNNFPDGWESEWQPSFDKAVIPSLYIPLPKESKDKDHSPQQITITLHTTGDIERERRRIKTLYGTLISHHGQDKFSFQIFENDKSHLIDFPNDTTRVSPELLFRLKKLMGGEYWTIETISLT